MKALVAGSAHLDILARPATDTAHRDRIGQVTIEAGGTACNIAFNLRRLDQEVRLLTAWGTSPIERLMASHIQGADVDLMADDVDGMPLAAFAAQMTAGGDLHSAVSSTPVDTYEFSDARIEQALDGVDYVVLEANLSMSTLDAIACAAHKKGLPVFALAVSEDKAERIRPILTLAHTVFMNAAECERLMAVEHAADPAEIAESHGTHLFVTRGERGAIAYGPAGERIRVHAPEIPPAGNLLGVGDAFSTGVIDALMRLECGMADAADHAARLVREIAGTTACNAFSLNALNAMVDTLYVDARIDSLTGLLRRSTFELEYRRFQEGWAHAVLFIDCDRFKSVNDRYGHGRGDEVLRDVASAIQSNIRGCDIASRWGGDEFVVLLPRTDLVEASLVGNRIRQAAGAADLSGVTLSIGVVATERNEDLASVIARSDKAMYQAKEAGRNTLAMA